nr:hypothetical protein Iba_chr11bCG14110 [Ipomoea batatas]
MQSKKMGKRKVRDEECESQLAKNVVRVEAEGETITPAIVGVSTTQEAMFAMKCCQKPTKAILSLVRPVDFEWKLVDATIKNEGRTLRDWDFLPSQPLRTKPTIAEEVKTITAKSDCSLGFTTCIEMDSTQSPYILLK